MKRGYIGLWLILALGLTIFLLFSLSDLEAPQIAGWSAKKAPFKDQLLGKNNVEADTAAMRQRLDSVRAAQKRVKTDSTPQSILLIGDSMTLNLAYRLSQYAKHNGHRFHAINWDSSNTKIWAQSDTLQHFIEEYNASYVFISLGSNELYLTHPEGHRKYVEAILEKVGDLPYVWIGPPNWKEDAGLNDMIESTCLPGSFFRSAGMTFERKRDKVHPTRGASALWIDSIARWMPKSAHPILLSLPPDSIGKVNPQVTFLKALNK